MPNERTQQQIASNPLTWQYRVHVEGKRDVLHHYEHVGHGEPLQDAVDGDFAHLFAGQDDDIQNIGYCSENAYLKRTEEKNETRLVFGWEIDLPTVLGATEPLSDGCTQI